MFSFDNLPDHREDTLRRREHLADKERRTGHRRSGNQEAEAKPNQYAYDNHLTGRALDIQIPHHKVRDAQ